MTVDAQIQPLLDQAAAAGPPDFERLTAADMRAGINGMLASFNAGRAPIEGIAARDISLRAAPPLPARLYRPDALSGRSAALVFFHGGGWVVGDLETHDVFCRRIAALAECTVISVDYRLAPEHVFPAAADDAVAAVEAVRIRSEELAIDPGRIVVGGDSAGGSLAAVAAQAAAKVGIALAGQLLICPSTDLASPPRPGGSRERLATGYLLTDPEICWYADQYLPAGAIGPIRAPRPLWESWPVSHPRSSPPPAMIRSATTESSMPGRWRARARRSSISISRAWSTASTCSTRSAPRPIARCGRWPTRCGE